MPIFRMKNCIHTASGIFAICKRLHSALVEKLLMNKENCVLKLVDEIILCRRSVIICQLIVHLLVIIKIIKRCMVQRIKISSLLVCAFKIQ